MKTNMKDYFSEENEELFMKVFRDTMECQFEHVLFDKSFKNQLQTDDDEFISQQGINKWMAVVDRGGPIPDNIYDYNFGEMFGLCRKAIDLEMQDLVKALRDRQIIP